MALNRFAIALDGFGKPATISGVDWLNGIPRALLITDGYFPRALSITTTIAFWFKARKMMTFKDKPETFRFRKRPEPTLG